MLSNPEKEMLAVLCKERRMFELAEDLLTDQPLDRKQKLTLQAVLRNFYMDVDDRQLGVLCSAARKLDIPIF